MANLQGLLAVPPKTTKSVEFGSFVRFIANNYDDEPSKYGEAVRDFGNLREATVVRTPDKHETGLDLLCRYYDQLAAIESKLPIAENQIAIKFTWYDAFKKKKAAMTSSVYERCCVLFNVGSLQSQIAKSQNFDSDEGLKNAIKQYQGAAGSFQLLQEHIFAFLQSSPTSDLCAESTTALKLLMLAHAQESFTIKASKDMKDPVIARIAMQTSDYYADAYSSMLVGTVKGQWEKGWLPVVAAKQSYFHAVAQHRLGLVAKENKNFGEAVARMKKALDLLSEADKKGEGYFKAYDITSALRRDHEQAVKDNNFIYNDLVPEFGALEPPGKAALAKPIQFPSPAANFQDLFSTLMPLAVSNALSEYNEKKEELISLQLERLRDSTQVLNAMLADRNLPAAIEDSSGDGLPDSLREKAEALQAQGGFKALEEKIFSLPELLQRNQEILEETRKQLNDEQREDTTLKERFKDKWSRQASSSLTEKMRQELFKFSQILENAGKADQTVRDKFQAHREGMLLLSKPPGELASLLPRAGDMRDSLKGSQSVGELRGLMEEVHQLKEAREVVESTLRDPTADIVCKFMEALKTGDLDTEAITEAHLRTEYGSLQQQAEESMEKQKGVAARIEASHNQFIQETQGQLTSAREAKLKELAAAYDAYQEITDNLSEGSKFYNDLTPLLLKNQSKISDFVFARNTEKEDLLKTLQKEIAQQPSAAPTASVVPQYQQGGAQPQQPTPAPRQPPARPPPPQTTPTQQAPPSSQQAQAHPHPQQPAPYPVQQQGAYAQPPPPQVYYQGGYAPPPQGYPQQPQPYGYYGAQPAPPQGYYGGQPPPPQGSYPPQQGSYYPGYPSQPYQPPPQRR